MNAQAHPAHHPRPAAGPVPGDLAGCVLLAVSAIVLAIGAGSWMLAAPLLALIVLHPVLAPRGSVRVGWIGLLILSVPFAILSQEREVSGTGIFILDFNFLYYTGMYLITVGLVALYAPPFPERIPRIVLCSVFALAGAGGEAMGHIYLAVLGVYAVGLLAASRAWMRTRSAERRGRTLHHIAIGAGFLLACGLTIASTIIIDTYYYQLTRIVQRYAFRYARDRMREGLDRNVRLGNVAERQARGSSNIALRAFAERAPGYLRAQVFDEYNRGRWSGPVEGQVEKVERDEDPDAVIGRVLLPGRSPPSASAQPALHVLPAQRYSEHFFLPLAASAIDTKSERVSLHAGGVVTSKDEPTARGYGVHLTDAALFHEASDQSLVQLPSDAQVRRELDRVLASLQVSEHEPEAAVRAIGTFFERRYTYRLGIQFERREDVLVQFLRDKEHGHCELFASAGVLLLRRAGIQARYITGFLCTERNPVGSLWIARERHAHAWVEYLHPTEGWRTAEFTPPRGRPLTHEPSNRWQGLWTHLGALIDRVVGLGVAGIIEMAAQVLGRAGRWILDAWWRVAILAGVLAFFAWTRLRQALAGRARKRRRERVFPPALQAQRTAFLRLERDLRRRGLPREGSETLEEFANRLAQADLEDRDAIAAFVRDFGAKRYAPFSVARS